MSSIPNAFERYVGANFLYLIGWSACFWSLGYVLLKGEKEDAKEDSNSSVQLPNKTTSAGTHDHKEISNGDQLPIHGHKEITCFGSVALWKTLNMPNLATVLGIIVGLIGGKDMLFGSTGALVFIGSGIEILGQPAVCLMTLIVFSNLARQLYLQKYGQSNNKNNNNSSCSSNYNNKNTGIDDDNTVNSKTVI